MKYLDNIIKIFHRQEEKGLEHYGQILEDNTELTDPIQIIEEAEEELVDALNYLEHAKVNIKKTLSKVGADYLCK